MEYVVPEPPIHKDDILAITKKFYIDTVMDYFASFTKKEAKIYFQWYTEQIEERIEYLGKYIHSQDPSIVLDFSVNSLITVWDWYVKQIEVEKYTRKELKTIAKSYPKWIRKDLMSDDRKMSEKTIAICSDVAIYFAEVFRKNHEQDVSWGYFTGRKTRMSVNEPILWMGKDKKLDMNPRHIVYICTMHAMDGDTDFNLYQLYHTWESDL